ncbi:alginate lyase-domain-containing protein [Dactylonectria estremocensis]|uniref:Alginate lyase-domain-containing protein n=1 Tax=Dactylonectria estremocensis TaxID=1079267 RepID=A0A9P9EFU7_9HYPO|nr:alginate lyase-domain-containing protein [Dactylonectria estremocensis]
MSKSNLFSQALLSVIFLGATQSAVALDSSCAPGGNFDLSKWTLQMPTGSEGSPDSISSSELEGCSGYTDSEYFYTNQTDGALVMKHCRTEFRENDPSWSPLDPYNRLVAELMVTENDDEICVGQIHIVDSISSKPVAELYYGSDGALSMGVQKCRTCTQQRSDIGNVPKGERFTYEIRYENDQLSVSINGGSFKTLDTFELDAPDSYFKAGNYNQGDGPTEVRFFKVRVSHSESDDSGSSSVVEPQPSSTTERHISSTQVIEQSSTLVTLTSLTDTPQAITITATQATSGDPNQTDSPTCTDVPSISSDSTVNLRLFAESNCCSAVQTTKLGNLNTCHNSSSSFQSLYQAVGTSMFGRNLRVYAYTHKGCSGTESTFKLTNEAECWTSESAWNSFKIARR